MSAKPLSYGPKHHFYGYYGINPWDPTGRYHLALETDFHEYRPKSDDIAKVVLIDAENQSFRSYGQTRAFNLQQGSMLHWIDVGFGPEFTFNDWEDDRLVSRAINFSNQNQRTIPGAIAAKSPTEPIAIGLSYDRMSHCRPVVGYANNIDPETLKIHPNDDGLFLLDLKRETSELILSIADVIKASGNDEVKARRAWFNHVVFNTDGSRLLFFCRVSREGGLYSSLWTVNPDGLKLECQISFRSWISHFDWRDEKRILLSTNLIGDGGFIEFTDGQRDYKPFGAGVLPRDGHACFSPDRKWIVCDRKFSENDDIFAELMLYNIANGQKTILGKFHQDKQFKGDIRCDLHPRWSSDGRFITFDSIHEGLRQVYMIDVSRFV